MTSVICPVYHPAGQDVRSEYGPPEEAHAHGPENGSAPSPLKTRNRPHSALPRSAGPLRTTGPQSSPELDSLSLSVSMNREEEEKEGKPLVVVRSKPLTRPPSANAKRTYQIMTRPGSAVITHHQKGRSWTTARLLPRRELFAVAPSLMAMDPSAKDAASASGQRRPASPARDTRSSAHFAPAGFNNSLPDFREQRRPDPADVYDSNRDRKELHIGDFRGVTDNPALMVRDTCGGRNRQRVVRAQSAPSARRAPPSGRPSLKHRPSTAQPPHASSKHGAARSVILEQIERDAVDVDTSNVTYEDTQYPGSTALSEFAKSRSATIPLRPASTYPRTFPIKTHNARANLERYRLEQVALRRLRYVIETGEAGDQHIEMLEILDNSELPSGLFRKFFGNKASNLAETRHLLMLAIERNKRRSGEAAGSPPAPQAGEGRDRTWAARTSRSPSSPRGGTGHRPPGPVHDLGLAVSPIFPAKGEQREECEAGPTHPSQRGVDTPPHFLEPSAYNHYLEHCAEVGSARPGRSRTATGESAASGGTAGARGFAAVRPGSATIYRPSLPVHTTPEDLLEMLRSSERKKGADDVHAAAEAARKIGVIVVPGTGYLPHKGGAAGLDVQGAAAKKAKAKQKRKKKRVWQQQQQQQQQQRRGPAPAHSFEKDAGDLDF